MCLFPRNWLDWISIWSEFDCPFKVKKLQKRAEIMPDILPTVCFMLQTGKLFLCVNGNNKSVCYCLSQHKCPHQTQNTTEHEQNNNLNILGTNEHLFLLQKLKFSYIFFSSKTFFKLCREQERARASTRRVENGFRSWRSFRRISYVMHQHWVAWDLRWSLSI